MVWPPTWILEASERENWASDEVARVGGELRRLSIEIEERADGVGIVGFDQYERLVSRSRPIRGAVYSLVRAERKRQLQILTQPRSRGLDRMRFYSEP
jgi:hypothetical protein